MDKGAQSHVRDRRSGVALPDPKSHLGPHGSCQRAVRMGGWDQVGPAGTGSPRSREPADPAAPGLKNKHTCVTPEKSPECLNTKTVEEETPHQHQPAAEHLNLQHSHRDTHQERPDLQTTHTHASRTRATANMQRKVRGTDTAAVHVPLFSMASISLVRRGGAVSGGPKCSAKSGNTKPEQTRQHAEAQGNKQEQRNFRPTAPTASPSPAKAPGSLVIWPLPTHPSLELLLISVRAEQ